MLEVLEGRVPAMNFLKITEGLNRFLYRKDVVRLTRNDLELATRWTKLLIRDGHPRWSESEIDAYYDQLMQIRVVAVDQWSRRMGADSFT